MIENLKQHKDLRGFVFTGTYSNESLELLKQVLIDQQVTDTIPDYVFTCGEGFAFLWNETATFNGPFFFGKSHMMTNMNINGVDMGSVFKIQTISEYINGSVD